jgi:mono/diheme cytochrome c family protein
MWKEIAVGSALLFLGIRGSSQEKQEAPQEPPAAEFKIPPEEAKRANPVKADASSIAQGKRLFSSQCAMCHGENGNGKGDLAEVMGFKPRDYRDPAALKEMSDGELFYILSNGKEKMPAQGDRMSVNQRWHLINFIRSLAKKEVRPKPKEEKPQ